MSEEKVLTLRGKKAVWAPGGGSGPIDPKRLPEGYPYKEQSEVVIEWDGNIDGLVNFGTYYKVSDTVYDDLSGAKVIVGSLESENIYDVTLEPKTEQQGVDIYLPSDVTPTNGMAAVAVAPQGNATGLSAGTYFYYTGGGLLYVAKLTSSTETIHPMAPEFLPGTTAKVTVNEDDMSATSDMTYAEINALVNSGSIKVELSTPLGVHVLNYCGCDGDGTLSFCTPWVLDPYNSTGIDVFFVNISSDDSIDFKWFKASGTW